MGTQFNRMTDGFQAQWDSYPKLQSPPALNFGYPRGLDGAPAFANPLRLSSGAQCPIDTGLAELGAPDDLGDRCTICSQGFHLINHWERQ